MFADEEQNKDNDKFLADEQCVVSVVIPAFNEEEDIVDTLDALERFGPRVPFEVIVVDNGSTDNTAQIVESKGGTVVHFPSGTIAAARNAGVEKSSGGILVFIDADVHVTEVWQNNIENVIAELEKSPLMVTGSRCLPPQNEKWLNKYWFARLADYEAPYINSGHLITTRILHDKIGGFSEQLKTAEDWDYGVKAKSAGAQIVDNKNLPAIHVGYPQTVEAFIKRERWHGREDFESLSSFKASKVAWVAAFHSLIFLLSLISVILNVSLAPVLPYLFVSALLSAGLTVMKFGVLAPAQLFPTACIFYLYNIGRSLALVDRVFADQKKG